MVHEVALAVRLAPKLHEQLLRDQIDVWSAIRAEVVDVRRGGVSDLPLALRAAADGSKSPEFIILAAGAALGTILVALKTVIDSKNKGPLVIRTKTSKPVLDSLGRPSLDARGETIVETFEKEEVVQPEDHSLLKYRMDASVTGVAVEVSASNE